MATTPRWRFPRKWKDAAALWDFLDTHLAIARDCLDEAAELGFVPPAFDGWDAPDLLSNVRIVAGVHPYGAEGFDDAAEALMRELLASPRCVGVGEIGLDFGPYNEVSPREQEECFRHQLRMAHELGLPVELHIRDGVDDMVGEAHALAVRVLAQEGVPEAGCDLHCFTSDARIMEDFCRLGCNIAFGGASTFSRSEDIRDAARVCPERLMVTETDCPYMAPVPLRGEECEPAMVVFVADMLARERETAGVAPAAQTYASLWRNACKLFGL